MEWQLGILKKMGFGGAHMHVRTGMTTPYLSDEYMELVKACVTKAKNENMLAWLYDEDRWPSGSAGGLVTKDVKYRGRYLLFTPFPYGNVDEEENTLLAGRPWIPLHSHYRDINLKLDLASDKSVFRFYRDLLKLRTNSEVIRVGDFKVLSEPDASYCAYTRTEGKDAILVICNFEEESRISFPYICEQVLLSNYGHSQKVDDIFKPYEIAVFKIKKVC